MELRKIFADNFYVYKIYFFLKFVLPHYILGSDKWDRISIKRDFKNVFGYEPNLDDPKTLNEKLQWLKLNARDDLLTICADKYRVREWLSKQFGDEYLIPLLFHTKDWRDLTPDKLPDIPCVVKSNGGNGDVFFIRDKNKIDWKKLQLLFRKQLGVNYYYPSHEWQYKNIDRCIIVEKLLLTKENKIPNDYKLTYFNGKLQFIYCSIDREGINKRNIYDPNWKPLEFSWLAKNKSPENSKGPDIPPPPSFDKMVEIGNKIARNFKYVRMDYYDVEGKLFFGEITLCHGSGYDLFYPEKYDLILGEKLNLK